MTTAFEAIEDAVVALLNTATAVSTNVETSEARILAAQETDGVIVRVTDSQMEPAAISGGPLIAQTVLEIELRKYGPVGQSAAKALDTLLAAVAGRIRASATLSGLAMDTMLQSLSFETTPGEKPAHSCLMTWQVLHEINSQSLA